MPPKDTEKDTDPDMKSVASAADPQMPADNDGLTAGEPDTALLIRLMRYQDGDLNDEECRQLSADLQQSAELRSIYSDIERGTRAARLALTRLTVVEDNRRMAAMPEKPSDRPMARPVSPFIDYRQAAAILIGIGIGLVGALYLERSQGTTETLRLAGLAEPTRHTDRVQAALQRALVPLLTGPAAMTEAKLDNDASGLHGTVRIEHHLQLAAAVPCADFSYKPQGSPVAAIIGLACQDPAGAWQVMTIDMAH